LSNYDSGWRNCSRISKGFREPGNPVMIDTSAIVHRLHTLESIAVIPRVASTNLVARRILDECLANELLLPQAMIIAGEQFAGRGRNERTWSSPRGKGIYATTLLTRRTEELPLVPLAMANIIAGYLRERFDIPAAIKWPNDVLVEGRKIAGILIEARVQDTRADLIIGTGINVEPFEGDQRPNATSIREAARRGYTGIDDATVAFIEYIDASLSRPFRRQTVLDEWRRLAVHKNGDRISSVFGSRTVEGSWAGIDDRGRALIRTNDETIAVSAGDVIVQ
jgi:BirA family transcriptional regulator, biotin operon repressor / biotin---[acetyl-CoA-carboxylase] ligase